MDQLDIVKLIEDNPITKLSSDYNIKLLSKIKENFTDFEQQLFLSSFYCYLNCDPINDFIIDLDNLWKWLDFCQKQRAKELLEKNFIIDKDYKCLLTLESEQKKGRGGHNIKKIVLNISTFKKFCLKAGTKKADEIHNYYMKLEQILQETINEECNELKLQLQNKDNIINEKQQEVEQALISQFPVNTECIYFGTIDNTNDNGEKLIKFGHTNDLSNRVSYHHKHYDNFTLKNAFRVQNKVEIENLIKSHPKIKPQLRRIKVNEKNKTEIIVYNDKFSIDKLTKIIKDIIQSKIYNIENFNKLTKQNEELLIENKLLNDKLKFLEKNNLDQMVTLRELREKLDNQQKILDLESSLARSKLEINNKQRKEQRLLINHETKQRQMEQEHQQRIEQMRQQMEQQMEQQYQEKLRSLQAQILPKHSNATASLLGSSAAALGSSGARLSISGFPGSSSNALLSPGSSAVHPIGSNNLSFNSFNVTLLNSIDDIRKELFAQLDISRDLRVQLKKTQ